MMARVVPAYIAQYIKTNQYFYLIKSKEVEGEWFFFDIENETPPRRIMWVETTRTAFKFPSEVAVEEFKAQFITPRRSEIIRLRAS